MKLFISLLVCVLVSLKMMGQNDDPKCDLKLLKIDIDDMFSRLDELNNNVLLTLIDEYSKSQKNDTVYVNQLKKHTQPFSQSMISEAKSLDAILVKGGRDVCFCYHLNKEIRDYKNSLIILGDATEKLISDNELDGISSNEFISSYNYAATSRSLLMSAMDNLKRFRSINDKSDEIDLKAAKVSNDTDIIKSDTENLNKKMDDMLCRMEKEKKRRVVWGIAGALVGGLIVNSAK